MIDHISVTISDPARTRRFYEKALAPLGYKVLAEIPLDATGGKAVWGMGVPPKADLWIAEGTPQQPRIHAGFVAETRAAVDAFYQAALASGGKDNGPPGVRAHYHKDYYAAFVLDPDGHNIEVVCQQPG